jgi:tRNA (cytidine/uridine-2'-O-)-methyltransferase
MPKVAIDAPGGTRSRTVMIRLALYQPDIAQNTGTLTRLCACLGAPLDMIGPAGFDMSDRNFRRAGMDYADRAMITRHDSWAAFSQWRTAQGHRLVLAETDGDTAYTQFEFAPGDIILLGRETAGVPTNVRAATEASVHIPQLAGLRSINVALAGAMILGEALRQTGAFAPFQRPLIQPTDTPDT